MHTYNIHEAKTHLSELLVLALQGEEVVIAKAGKPLVKLALIEEQPKKRVAGLHAGTVLWIADDFDDPLPEDFLITPMDWPTTLENTEKIKK